MDENNWVIESLEDFVVSRPTWFDAKRGEDYGKELIEEVKKLQALADHYPDVVEALGEADDFFPSKEGLEDDNVFIAWYVNYKQTLTTAQALLPSVSSGQGDSADKETTHD